MATRILWSGSGRLPLDRRGDEDFTTFWSGNVLMPDGFPSVAGPDPRSDFIRSARLADFARKLEELVQSQRATWLRAAVEGPWDKSLAWQLEIAWDRGARLVIHESGGERVERFQLTFAQTRGLEDALRNARGSASATFGSGRSRQGARTLELLDPAAPRTLRIDWLPWDAVTEELGHVLDLWTLVRGLFDEPRCADHRSKDRDHLR